MENPFSKRMASFFVHFRKARNHPKPQKKIICMWPAEMAWYDQWGSGKDSDRHLHLLLGGWRLSWFWCSSLRCLGPSFEEWRNLTSHGDFDMMLHGIQGRIWRVAKKQIKCHVEPPFYGLLLGQMMDHHMGKTCFFHCFIDRRGEN